MARRGDGRVHRRFAAASVRPLRIALTILTLHLTALTALTAQQAQAAMVTVSGDRILVDGKPFALRGGAGEMRLDLLKNAGGTMLRTWGGDPGAVLDAARAAGLKVAVGLWMGHPRLGADYADPGFVERQTEQIIEIVEKYKNHPALLMWGVGNEIEVDTRDDALLWPAIEAVAKQVKARDPDHPTMAVIAEMGDGKVGKIKQFAPSIDVLGVNSYGAALNSIGPRAREQGWTGPVVVTEAGVLGHWQAALTPWGAPYEPTSTQKAIEFRRYLKSLDEQGVGVAVFFWGQKQEVTPSYHSLFLPTGEWTETLESMAETWGGTTPEGNKAPRIATLRFAHDESAPFASFTAGQGGAVVLDVLDPDGDPLDVEWEIAEESTVRSVGGDPEAPPRTHPEGVAGHSRTGARIGALPPGRYRIFVTVRDGRGAGATGNLPFEVR